MSAPTVHFSSPHGRLRQAAVGALLTGLLLLTAQPVTAAAEPVTINLHAVFEPSDETFTATGFCPEGSAETIGFRFAGRTFHLFKELTCDDGSGTLIIRVEANLTWYGTIGGWNVVGGTGDYAGVRGGGQLVGFGFDGGIDDVYTGRLTR